MSLPSLQAPCPRRDGSGSAAWAKGKTPKQRALTGLQGGQWLRLLAELAVPNVIGRLHSELVGGEGLEPVGGVGFNERRHPLEALSCHLCSGGERGQQLGLPTARGTDRNAEAQKGGPPQPDHAPGVCGHSFSSILSHWPGKKRLRFLPWRNRQLTAPAAARTERPLLGGHRRLSALKRGPGC